MTCECHLFNVKKEETWKYSCQTKVNNNILTMKDYQTICMNKGPVVEISHEEFKRLTNLYGEKGIKWSVDEETREIVFT